MDTLPFYIFLFVHLISLIVGFGSVLVIDFFGLLALMKRINLAFTMKVANQTQKLIWLGWSGLVLSGIGLITLKGYVDNLTVIKLFFVFMVGLNGVFLHTIKKAIERMGDISSMDEMPAKYRFRIALASAISQLGWWGALFIGFIHRHWQHRIEWPPSPVPYIVGIIAVIVIAIIVGSIGSRQRTKPMA